MNADATTIIDSYTNDVARRLPRRMRNDVGLELRALLTDALNVAAADAGRAADRELALEVLRKFGHPQAVAARYAPPGFNVIEPEHAPWFVRLAVGCVAVQWAVTLPRVFTSELTVGQWWMGWGLGALWWVGLLTAYFGAAGWLQRRSPLDAQSFTRPWTHYVFWVPTTRDWLVPDQEAAIRYGGGSPGSNAVGLLLAILLAVFFVSPPWFLDLILPSDVDTAWARYDAAFQRDLLAPLIGVIAARIALFSLAAFNERWRARTEPVRFGLWVALVGLLIWALLGWDIFAAPRVDFFFKVWLSAFLLVNCIQIAVFVRRALTRIRVPKSFYNGGNA